MKFFFNDPQYSFQSLRALSVAPTGGADVGEVLSTVYRIKEGDDESWYREWLLTAQRLEKLADGFLADGHKVSAKEAYYRASSYYRSAEFFLHSDTKDPRIVETWRKSRDCFLKGAKLSDTPIIKSVEIPYESTTLPGYLVLSDSSGKKRPLLIIHTGFDGTAEELYFSNAVSAIARGYNCLIFEGPGQGRVIREQKIPFRYDWEKVVTPVVDFALKQREVDPKRIALLGISFGGYLAPRAAAFEHRIKAYIANGGVYDFHEVVMRRTSPDIEKILDDKVASEELDKETFTMMQTNVSIRWAINDGMWKFDAKSPSDWMRKTRAYTLKNVVNKIKGPILVVDSEDDMDMPGQAKKLYEALKGKKDFMLFTREFGAGEHCQAGAGMISNERILNWLDKTLKK